MRTLGVMCPNSTDATSLYRAIGPLGELQSADKHLRIELMQKCDWSTLKLVDAVFMQRPFTNAHLRIAQMIKANNKPLWVDFDDDLFAVPQGNPCFETFSKPEIQKNIATVIAMADVLTVSTDALMQKFSTLNDNISVIPNAIDMALIGENIEPEIHRQPLIMWRGSKTHRKDLNTIAESCIHLAKKMPYATWVFVGDVPWFVDYMPDKQVICADALDPVEYFEFLKKTKPAVFIVPLEDSDFNRSKSNCAWLEASWSGAATIAPALPEFIQPGISNYHDTNEFSSHVQFLIDNPVSRVNKAMESWNYIDSHLRLSFVNQLRLSILSEVGI